MLPDIPKSPSSVRPGTFRVKCCDVPEKKSLFPVKSSLPETVLQLCSFLTLAVLSEEGINLNSSFPFEQRRIL